MEQEIFQQIRFRFCGGRREKKNLKTIISESVAKSDDASAALNKENLFGQLLLEDKLEVPQITPAGRARKIYS